MSPGSGIDRKEFLRAALAAAAALAVPPLARAQGRAQERADSAEGAPLPHRTLGRDGPPVTVLGLGGFHLGRVEDERAARRLVEVALDEGVRFFDNAESYQDGRAERWMGAALAGAREEVFLMTKTHSPQDRSAESARRHLEGSLERLRTDHLDLWQLHSVKSPDDVDLAFRQGGAMEAILAAKAEGLVRHVGVTGHHDPEANLRTLHHFDRGMRFDAMQMPIHPIDHHQTSFQRRVLPELVRRGIGVIAMKTSAQRKLLDEGICSIEECLRFVWSLPVSVAVVGMERPEEVRENARLARRGALGEEEAAALLERIEPRADLALEWYKRR